VTRMVKCLAGFSLILALGAVPAAAQQAKSPVERGIENSQRGRYDQAIQDFNEALKSKPNDPLLITYRGVVYYAKGQNARALQDFNKAIAINPNFGKAYYQRGMVYYHQEKFAQAATELRKAKSLGYSVDPVFIDSVANQAASKKIKQ
jgi:tetratricopeptide (TPR) repeat protein